MAETSTRTQAIILLGVLLGILVVAAVLSGSAITGFAAFVDAPQTITLDLVFTQNTTYLLGMQENITSLRATGSYVGTEGFSIRYKNQTVFSYEPEPIPEDTIILTQDGTIPTRTMNFSGRCQETCNISTIPPHELRIIVYDGTLVINELTHTQRQPRRQATQEGTQEERIVERPAPPILDDPTIPTRVPENIQSLNQELRSNFVQRTTRTPPDIEQLPVLRDIPEEAVVSRGGTFFPGPGRISGDARSTISDELIEENATGRIIDAKFHRYAMDQGGFDAEVPMIVVYQSAEEESKLAGGERYGSLQFVTARYNDLAGISGASDSPVRLVTVDIPVRVAATSSAEHIGATALVGNEFSGALGACVVDTGLSDHERFEHNVVGGINLLDEDDSFIDDHGHGTSMVDALLAVAPGAQLYIAKALNEQGVGKTSTVIKAIDWCMQQPVEVISLSLGAETYPSWCDEASLLAQKANEAAARGITVVAAAGNQGPGSMTTPACGSLVTSVAATNALASPETLWEGSSVSEVTWIAAPGMSVSVGERSLTGSSVSAAIASGAALVVQETTNTSGSELRDLLRESGTIVSEEYRLPSISVTNAVLGNQGLTTQVEGTQSPSGRQSNTDDELYIQSGCMSVDFCSDFEPCPDTCGDNLEAICTTSQFSCNFNSCGYSEDPCPPGEFCEFDFDSGSAVCAGCTPTTSCSAQDRECGSIWNGCEMEDCGTCLSGYSCDDGTCVCDFSCAGEGFECGSYFTCGETFNCGTCGSGFFCDGGTCEPEPETYSWFTGPWSSCSAECGSGTQTRTVYCERESDGAQVSDSFCSGSKPAESQGCTGPGCPSASSWSCSGSCSRCRTVYSCSSGTCVSSQECENAPAGQRCSFGSWTTSGSCSTSNWACTGGGSPNSCSRERDLFMCNGFGTCNQLKETQSQNAPSGQVCDPRFGNDVFVSVSASNYCGIGNDCASGSCSGTINYRSCTGSGTCRTNNVESHSVSVSANQGEVLNTACNSVSGTCGTGSWSCTGSGSPNSCSRERPNYACTSGGSCSFTVSTTTQNAGAGNVCHNGNFVSGSSTRYCGTSSATCVGEDYGEQRYACASGGSCATTGGTFVPLSGSAGTGSSCDCAGECSSGICETNVFQGSVTSQRCLASLAQCIDGGGTVRNSGVSVSGNTCYGHSSGGSVWLANTGRYIIQDNSNTLAIIDRYGSMAVRGSLTTGTGSFSSSGWILENSGGTPRMSIASSSGNMRIAGSVTERTTSLTGNGLIVRNPAGTAQAILRDDGNVRLRGDIAHSITSLP